MVEIEVWCRTIEGFDNADRQALLDQQPAVLWFTGLSGAGKSTIANHLETLLHRDGYKTMLLDGDSLRLGLNCDLGFSKRDRIEKIRRVSEVAKLMTEAGLIVIVALISPFRSERQRARHLMAPGEFIEIFVDTPIEECIRRDPKGLYRRALAGEIENMIGLDAPYERPQSPELHLQTEHADPMALARQIFTFLKAAGG